MQLLGHDKEFLIKPTYAPEDYVFVGRLTLTTFADEHLATEGYSKLVPKGMVRTGCFLSDQSTPRYFWRMSKTPSVLKVLRTYYKKEWSGSARVKNSRSRRNKLLTCNGTIEHEYGTIYRRTNCLPCHHKDRATLRCTLARLQ